MDQINTLLPLACLPKTLFCEWGPWNGIEHVLFDSKLRTFYDRSRKHRIHFVRAISSLSHSAKFYFNRFHKVLKRLHLDENFLTDYGALFFIFCFSKEKSPRRLGRTFLLVIDLRDSIKEVSGHRRMIGFKWPVPYDTCTDYRQH